VSLAVTAKGQIKRPKYDKKYIYKVLSCAEAIGIRGPTLALLNSYLSNRSFFVKINNSRSDESRTETGVPQGSKLGPTLFLILINSLPRLITSCKIMLYADDTVLSYSANTIDNVLPNLQEDLKLLQYWAHDFGIVINAKKTIVMCFSSPHKLVNGNQIQLCLHTNDCLHRFNHLLSCSCEVLELTDTIKYLGVTLDSRMSYHQHIQAICSKLRSAAFAVSRLSYLKFPFPILRLIYYSLAESHLNYCIEAWGLASDTALKPLIHIQNRLIRLLYYSFNNSYRNTSNMYKVLNILPFKSLHSYRSILNNFFCPTFKIPRLYSANTRELNHAQYVIPRFNTSYGKRTRSVSVPTIFNALPLTFSNIQTFNSLKLELKTYLLHDDPNS